MSGHSAALSSRWPLAGGLGDTLTMSGLSCITSHREIHLIFQPPTSLAHKALIFYRNALSVIRESGHPHLSSFNMNGSWPLGTRYLLIQALRVTVGHRHLRAAVAALVEHLFNNSHSKCSFLCKTTIKEHEVMVFSLSSLPEHVWRLGHYHEHTYTIDCASAKR